MAQQPELPKDWLEYMQRMWNPMGFPMPGVGMRGGRSGVHRRMLETAAHVTQSLRVNCSVCTPRSACRPAMQVPVAAQVDEMGSGKQQAAARHQNAVNDDGMAFQIHDAKHQQGYARRSKEQRQRLLITTKAAPQRQRCQATRKQHKNALKPVIGEEPQADKRQQGQHERQHRAMHGAQE